MTRPACGQQNPAYGFDPSAFLNAREILMSFYTERAQRWGLNRIFAVFCCLLALLYAGLHILRIKPPSTATQETAAAPAWPEVEEPPAEIWSIFSSSQPERGGPPAGPLGQRFRLAGTFFAFTEQTASNDGSERRAIIDDLGTRQQYLVQEGEIFEEVQVVRILNDRVLVRSEGKEEELWLSFAGEKKSAPASAGTQTMVQVVGDEEALETGRFGKRVAENRWVFQREALLGYYQELLDDPERMAAIFLSMKPDYQEGGIAGYHLDQEGEQNFFKDVGLQQGDVVRKVNSMRMTSQARAEYFIKEFMQNRISAVVLEIERDGDPQKLIYLFR